MILLLNDDGIRAPGLRALYHALVDATGLPVLAVAPLGERSGQSHAITLDRALHPQAVVEGDFIGFAVDGTPTDCAKLALDRLCPRPPKLVVSGINHGANCGRSIFYSGTLGAAMEAAVLGFPALAVSRERGAGAPSDGATFAAGWARRLLGQPSFAGSVVNLNLPRAPAAMWGETAIVRHGLAGYRETYGSVREADGSMGFMLHGEWHPSGEDDDAARLTAGHPVLTLLKPDLNAAQGALRRLLRDG